MERKRARAKGGARETSEMRGKRDKEAQKSPEKNEDTKARRNKQEEEEEGARR